MVEAICKALDMDSCDGLEKSTGAALNKLMHYLRLTLTGLALYNQGLTTGEIL